VTPNAKPPYLLLIEDGQGDTIGVRFPTAEAAREWEDEHQMEIGTVRGVVRVVTTAEAIKRG
jgi:hypothetical protein